MIGNILMNSRSTANSRLYGTITLEEHRADGTTQRSVVWVKSVTLVPAGILPAQSGPLDLPIFPFNRIQHVIARHTAAAINPRLTDGIFFPEWSTPDKLRELAVRIYSQAGPAHLGAGKSGNIAFVAGAVNDTNTRTWAATPHMIGSESSFIPSFRRCKKSIELACV